MTRIGRIVFARPNGNHPPEVYDPQWKLRMFGEKLASVKDTVLLNPQGEHFHSQGLDDDKKESIEAFSSIDQDGCFYSLQITPQFLYRNGSIVGDYELGIFEPTEFLASFASRPSKIRIKPKITLDCSPLTWYANAQTRSVVERRDYDLHKSLRKKELVGIVNEDMRRILHAGENVGTFIQTSSLIGINRLVRNCQNYGIEDEVFGDTIVYAENNGQSHITQGYNVACGADYVFGMSREQFGQIVKEIAPKMDDYFSRMSAIQTKAK
jgi:hypothetical protein